MNKYRRYFVVYKKSIKTYKSRNFSIKVSKNTFSFLMVNLFKLIVAFAYFYLIVTFFFRTESSRSDFVKTKLSILPSQHYTAEWLSILVSFGSFVSKLFGKLDQF